LNLAAVAQFVWYLVVASPQSGMVIMPDSFNTQQECAAAVEEYAKSKPTAGWVLQCIPGASFSEEGEPEASPN